MGRSTRLLLLLRPYTPLFVANLVTTVVASVLDGVTFVLLIPFLRTLFGQEALPASGGSAVERLLAAVVGPMLGAGAPHTALHNVVLVLLGTLVLKNVLAYVAALTSVAIQENVVRDLRVRLFEHLQTLSLGFFQRTRGGQLLARVINDTDQVKTAITAALASLLQNASLIVVYVGILVGLSWRLTLVALVCAPLLVLIVRPMVGKVRRRSREQADQRGELTSLVSELVASIKLVRAYVAERFEADRFRTLADRYRKGVLRAQRYALLTSPVSEVFAGGVIVLIFAVGTRLALGQTAVLRPDGRHGPRGWRSDHAVHALQPAIADGHRLPGDDPPERHGVREHRLRAERFHAGPGSGRGPRGQRGRFRLAAPRGLPHAAGGARHAAQRGRAPAHRHRARPAAGSADPDSGRGDQRPGHGVRASGTGGDRPADGAPHDVRRRPSARHGAARRPDRRARRRADRRAPNARRAVRRERVVSAPARPAVPSLTCSRVSPSSATRSSSTTPSCPRFARS